MNDRPQGLVQSNLEREGVSMFGKLWLVLLLLAMTGGAALAQSAAEFTVAPGAVQDPATAT
jgi:hypothetical protein